MFETHFLYWAPLPQSLASASRKSDTPRIPTMWGCANPAKRTFYLHLQHQSTDSDHAHHD